MKKCHPLLIRERRDCRKYSHGFSSSQIHVLDSICETLIPPLQICDVSDGDLPNQAFNYFYKSLGPDEVLDAKMVWVDRLGFDMLLRSTHNDVFEVRIPFPRQAMDEKAAQSGFNGMSQLALEVEKNVQVPEFRKVKQPKKIRS